MVEYSMDVSIVKPIDVKRGNGTLLYDVVNRGREQLPSFNLGGTATSPGDGFLELHGFTLVFSGWEGDLAGGIRITLPVAHNPDGIRDHRPGALGIHPVGVRSGAQCHGGARLRSGRHRQ